MAAAVHIPPMGFSAIGRRHSAHRRPYINIPSLLQLSNTNHRSIRLNYQRVTSSFALYSNNFNTIFVLFFFLIFFWKQKTERRSNRSLSTSMSMNGCPRESSAAAPLQIIQTRTLDAVSAPSAAFHCLSSALAHLNASPPPVSSGIIRLQVFKSLSSTCPSSKPHPLLWLLFLSLLSAVHQHLLCLSLNCGLFNLYVLMFCTTQVFTGSSLLLWISLLSRNLISALIYVEFWRFHYSSRFVPSIGSTHKETFCLGFSFLVEIRAPIQTLNS